MLDDALRLIDVEMCTLTTYTGEFDERSEEGERWNQKTHQKVQKDKPQLPLSGSLPLSGTQEVTLDPLRGKMAAEGKKPTHALTAERQFTTERHFYGLGPNFSNTSSNQEPAATVERRCRARPHQQLEAEQQRSIHRERMKAHRSSRNRIESRERAPAWGLSPELNSSSWTEGLKIHGKRCWHSRSL
ncbi:hypothetical protein LR48_Vigan151s001100 [Vigna angularis]|uniref:Uncharacterized protein n=1 Tax=Phaseolus angularis TaxID=3914 RepID=A0A0L9T518_PHAAN|nr:hypothetical protein LR48_Vigan151s001100 [Vigna angularis]